MEFICNVDDFLIRFLHTLRYDDKDIKQGFRFEEKYITYYAYGIFVCRMCTKCR